MVGRVSCIEVRECEQADGISWISLTASKCYVLHFLNNYIVSLKFYLKCKSFHSRKCIWSCLLQNGIHFLSALTHWGRVTHICVGKLTTIASDDGLAPSSRQAIIWTNDGILLIGPSGTNFSDRPISIKIHIFSFKKMHLKMWSGNWQPFCLGLNVLMGYLIAVHNLLRFTCIHPYLHDIKIRKWNYLSRKISASGTQLRRFTFWWAKVRKTVKEMCFFCFFF